MKPEPDPDPGRCAFEIVGQRCHWRGVYSRDGKHWYCREHRRTEAREATPPPGGFDALRAIVRPKRADPEADAERAAIQHEGEA